MPSLWWFISDMFLLGFGSKYEKRYQDGFKDMEDHERRHWREDNQKEWDRIAVVLALVATLQAASLAIPDLPMAAWPCRALWIGGASLSVTGLIAISYLTVSLFNINDDDFQKAITALSAKPHKMMASVGAFPVVSLLWSTIFYLVGLIVYALTVDHSKDAPANAVPRGGFRVLAAIPIFSGIFILLCLVVVVEKRLHDTVDNGRERNATSSQNPQIINQGMPSL